MKRTCVRQIVVVCAASVDARGRRLHRRQDRHGDRPRDDQPDEHRHADRQSDEMSGAEQRERPRDVVAGRRRARRAEEARELGRRRCASP